MSIGCRAGRISLPMSVFVEFFSLRGAATLASSLPQESMGDVDRALRVGRQKYQAAEALWAAGCLAEALRLSAQGLTVLTDALAGIRPEEEFGAEQLNEMLRRGGMSARRAKVVQKAIDLRRTFTLPSLDDEAPADAPDVLRTWQDAQSLLQRTFEPVLMSSRQRFGVRLLRAVVVLLLLCICAAPLVYLALRKTPDSVIASGTLGAPNDPFIPSRAFDGNESTWWLAPDRAHSAWLEVRPGSPRRVQRIRLLNSVSPPWNDRGTRDYSVEIYSGGRIVRTLTGSFPTTMSQSWVNHDVNIASVERVRFVARTWREKGPALAEIRLE